MFNKRWLLAVLAGLFILNSSYATFVPGSAGILESGPLNGSNVCYRPTTADLPYLVSLYGGANSTSGGNYYNTYGGNGTITGSAYMVAGTGRTGSVSPTLYIYQICWQIGVGGGRFTIGISKNPAASEGTATRPNGAVDFGPSGGSGLAGDILIATTAATVYCKCVNRSVPNTWSLYWVPGSGTQNYGLEVSGVLQ